MTCGMSLNQIDKDEVLDREPAGSENAKHDQRFFDDKRWNVCLQAAQARTGQIKTGPDDGKSGFGPKAELHPTLRVWTINDPALSIFNQIERISLAALPKKLLTNTLMVGK